MKKSFLTLLLTAFMLVFTASVAFAAETGSPINIPGQVVAEENGFRLIAMNSEVLDGQVHETFVENENDDNSLILPRSHYVPRVDPTAAMVCPVVDYNGEPTILDVEAVEFIAGPTAGLNYIAANYPKADQERVKAIVKNAGYTQLGWYFIGGYNVDVYKPINWSYNEYKESGMSARLGASAKNGEKYFEVYSPFLEDGTTKDDWKFGISGKIAYQTYPDYKTANIAIGLYFYMK